MAGKAAVLFGPTGYFSGQVVDSLLLRGLRRRDLCREHDSKDNPESHNPSIGGAANLGCSRLSRRLRARTWKRIVLLSPSKRPPEKRLQPRLAAPHSGKPQTEAIGSIPWLPPSSKRQRGKVWPVNPSPR